MTKKIVILLMLIFSTQQVYAACSTKQAYWRAEIKKSRALEQFFLQNYECKGSFYKALRSSEKLYFDTVMYPQSLNEKAYKNRWNAMLSTNDRDFFKSFPTFNNYFKRHKGSITKHQLHCFQKQQGFQNPLSSSSFYHELKMRKMLNDVGYLYPLIRWSYMGSGIDMSLSRERVAYAEKNFGIKKGKVGDNIQFARYLALFNMEYSDIAQSLSEHLEIKPIEAYKILAVITYLESRGNLFAVSTTGAFGPLQLTMHYYMMYGEPNNPFNPKSSLAKLANKFVHYRRIGKDIDSSVIAYKSGSLEKCKDSRSNDVDCRYYRNFKHYMAKMQGVYSKEEVSRHLTGKSYFFSELSTLKRVTNANTLQHYEPYQYAVLKGGILRDRAVKSMFLDGKGFYSLGKMKRSDIYDLQDRYGVAKIGVISDKKVCY